MAGSSWRDHEGMPKRLTVLAYALFGFAIVLAGVAVVGAGSRPRPRSALVKLLDHQHGDRSVRSLRSLDPAPSRTTRSAGSSSFGASPRC